jgi:hypothetical protein
MSLSLSEEHFIEVCLDAAKEYNSAVIGNDNKIQWELGGIQECYRRSMVTAELFKMEHGINYYREAGQYCYWIRKLKPFFLPGHSSPLVNEFISFWTAAQIIHIAQDEIHSQLFEKDQSAAQVCEDEAEANYDRVLRLEEKVANSLRYYVHSSGSIPILFEALFSISADAEFA